MTSLGGRDWKDTAGRKDHSGFINLLPGTVRSVSGWSETAMAESIVLAAMVAVLQLSGSARALTEPDCPVMEGTRKLLVN